MSTVKDIIKGVNANGLSSSQKAIIDEAKKGGVDEKQLAQMTAQMKMDNLSSMTQMMSNLLKKLGETSAAVIGNIR